MTAAIDGSAGLGMTVSSASNVILRVDGVVKEYRLRVNGSHKTIRAVDDVSFACSPSETIGIVGESGSGKTTLGRIVAALISPTSGSVEANSRSDVENSVTQSVSQARRRPRTVQMVYQNPAESLNPRWKIESSVAEPLIGVSGSARRAAVTDALEAVGLSMGIAQRHPHQLSGGQQQRACIARAVIGNPSVIVLDEAVSGLDVVLQREVLILLRELQSRTQTSYLFISHDLSAVAAISTRILVMYLGRVVESVPTAELNKPYLHPYSVVLHSAQLRPMAEGERPAPIVIAGEPPSGINKVEGCRFAPRCPLADDRCRLSDPPLLDHGNGHLVACYHPGELVDAS